MKNILTVVLLALTGCQAWAGDQIRWLDWSADAFAEARSQNKLILVNVGHEGCTACRFMAANTFIHQDVIDLANANFVAIQVDSEARPDIDAGATDRPIPDQCHARRARQR